MSNADLFVDCSSNNGIPNITAYARAGYRKLSRKVSEGTGYHWFEGDDVAHRAHAAGLTVEHYHWLRPDQPATLQADYFVKAIGANWRPGDDLMTDFEATYSPNGRVSDKGDAYRAYQLAEFNARVTQLLAKPRVYTGNWYLAEMGGACQTECRKWDVVMSDYSGTSVLPNPYGLRYVAWQFTDRANVAGFAGPVDLNRTLIQATPTPTTQPDSSSTTPLGGDMATIVVVNRSECQKKGIRWPGCFLTDGFRLEHIATQQRLKGLQHSGFLTKTISVADYRGLGGK